MKKRKIFFGVVLLVMAIIGYWFFFRANPTNSLSNAPQDTGESLKTATPSAAKSIKEPATNLPTSGVGLAKIQSQYQSRTNTLVYQEIGTDLRHLDSLYDTPVDFYGKVVDETGAPIENVSATVSVSDLSSEGASRYATKTDVNGLFSLTGKTGIKVVIYLSKDSYYIPAGQNYSFDYIDRSRKNFHRADPSVPVIFRLKKKADGEKLIVWEKKLPLNLQSPVRLNLQTGDKDSVGDFQLELKANNKGRGNIPQEWAMHLAVMNGGLLTHTDEFPFLAPENGYEPGLEINLETPKPESWSGAYAGGEFFVKASDTYSRIQIRMVPGTPHLRISCFLNPSGSRNLEYDESKQPPKQTVFE